MYVFDSYLLILYKSIVSPSIHENLHAPSETAELQIWSIMEAKKQFICYWRHIVKVSWLIPVEYFFCLFTFSPFI